MLSGLDLRGSEPGGFWNWVRLGIEAAPGGWCLEIAHGDNLTLARLCDKFCGEKKNWGEENKIGGGKVCRPE